MAPGDLRRSASRASSRRRFRRMRLQYPSGTPKRFPSAATHLRVGPFDLEATAASVEIQGDASTIDIPVDAIVGTAFLSHVDLWFDYDGEALYAKPF